MRRRDGRRVDPFLPRVLDADDHLGHVVAGGRRRCLSRAFGRCARWNACEGLMTLTLCAEKSFLERNLEPTQLLGALPPELTTRSAEVAGRDVEIAPSPVDLAEG